MIKTQPGELFMEKLVGWKLGQIKPPSTGGATHDASIVYHTSRTNIPENKQKIIKYSNQLINNYESLICMDVFIPRENIKFRIQILCERIEEKYLNHIIDK